MLTEEQKKILKEQSKNFKEWIKSQEGQKDLEERKEKENYFQKIFKKEDLLNRTEAEIRDIIKATWALRSWTKKDYFLDKVFQSIDVEELKRKFYDLLYGDYSEDQLFKRINNFVDNVKGIGVPIASEILASVFPDKFWIDNEKLRTVLETLKLEPEFKHGEKLNNGLHYQKRGDVIKDIFEYLKEQGLGDLDFLRVDRFIYYLWLKKEEIFFAGSDEAKDIETKFNKIKADPVKVHELLDNVKCPDSLKKEYLKFLFEEGHIDDFKDTSRWDYVVRNIKLCLLSWEPVKKDFKLPVIDKSDPKTKDILDRLIEDKQIILYGVPGTGKTRMALMIANSIAGKDNYEILQFHPSYSYEDFVEGIFPRTREDKIFYEVEKKIFLEVCERANNSKGYFVLIIDEINRADLSKVFGELLFALEPEYRLEGVNLAYSEEKLKIPNNLLIVGTMNTLDKSTTDIDQALRRRFSFIPVNPSKEALIDILDSNKVDGSLKNKIIAFFEEIYDARNPAASLYPLGHAYFKSVKVLDDMKLVWKYKIKPLIEDFYGEFEREKIEEIERIYKKHFSNETEA